MQENYDHYISRNIKSLYRRRLFGPLLYLIFIIAVFIVLPVTSVVFPTELFRISDMGELHSEKDVFISASLHDLHFTGYTKTRFNRTVGYFYYMDNPDEKECCIVLLSPTTCEQGLPEIPQVRIHGKILAADANYNALLTNLSADLSWSDTGIHSKVNPYYLSEPDFKYGFGLLLFIFLSASGIYSMAAVILCILYICRPDFSPPCQMLGHFGKPKQLLALAEEELATLPQLATEDMFITEHFFIETSKYGIAIVPIKEIIWIYKHSTLHKLFWYHFSISYTLNITANKHVYIHCPKNIKSDIDGIMDYLSEANHDILVGFSEENRQKIHDIQGDPFHFEKLAAFMKRRI